ncbi:hypothetical protein CF328_g7549 [Tilletia controversa]|nr:hypothetical protein CF328_g7549 [Tilletia controversa]
MSSPPQCSSPVDIEKQPRDVPSAPAEPDGVRQPSNPRLSLQLDAEHRAFKPVQPVRSHSYPNDGRPPPHTRTSQVRSTKASGFESDHTAATGTPPPFHQLHLSEQQQEHVQDGQSSRRGSRFLRPWQTTFESPSIHNLVALLVHCAAAYALVRIVPSAITHNVELKLYWTRAIVTATTTIAGMIVCGPIHHIANRIIYSAMWTAVILEEDVTMGNLDSIGNDVGMLSGLRLLFLRLRAGAYRVAGENRSADQSDRAGIPGRISRFYRATRGTPEIIAALGLLLLAQTFGFVSDRTISIRAQTQPQYQHFDAISVGGDLSDADASAATVLLPFYEDYIRSWTLQSTAALKLPSTVKLPIPNQPDQYAYFTEVLHDHFFANYEGYGSFTNETHTASENETEGSSEPTQEQDDSDKSKKGDQSSTTLISNDGTEITLRWNTHCQRLENLSRYLVPDISQSRNASVDDREAVFFLTHEVLSSVLSRLDVSLPSNCKVPQNLTTPDGTILNNDILPADLKAAEVVLAKPFAADGVAQSFWSLPMRSDEEILLDEASSRYSPGSAGRGWVSLEVILIRLNQTLAGPGARFGMIANVSDHEGNFGNVGFDLGVCVERLDPYVVEVFRGLSVRSTSIIRQADDLTLEGGQRRSLLVSAETTNKLSSKGKYAAYNVAHKNARNALFKDNGRDSAWVPNPTLTSMSSGAVGGPAGYGVLDPMRLADMLASADTRLLLPYLVGHGKLEARSYEFIQIARASCVVYWLNIVIGVVIGCCLLGILLVPRLPAGLPRRSTSPISWLAVYGSLRIGGLPVEDALFGESSPSTTPDRKIPARFFASFHHPPHDSSRLSATTSSGGAGQADIEQTAQRDHPHPHRSVDGQTLPEGARISLNDIEKRVAKELVSYAVCPVLNLHGELRRREHQDNRDAP